MAGYFLQERGLKEAAEIEPTLTGVRRAAESSAAGSVRGPVGGWGPSLLSPPYAPTPPLHHVQGWQ